MDHTCAMSPSRPLLFTSHSGDVFELQPEELEETSSLHPLNEPLKAPPSIPEIMELHPSILDGVNDIATTDGPASPLGDNHVRRFSSSRREPFCPTSSPLVTITNADDSTKDSSTASPAPSPPPASLSPNRSRRINRFGGTNPQPWMVYNEFGELVNAQTVLNPPKADELNNTQILRLIKKAYHHDVSTVL